MPRYARAFRLLPLATLLCVGSCLSTEGYYRYQDAGASGAAGTTGSAGSGSAGTTGSAGSGVAGTTGSGGSAGGAAGTVATGRGGTTGAAGAAGGRGGSTGAAGSSGRGGTTGTAGTTGSGGSGAVLFMDDFESGLTKWDFGAIPMSMTPIIMDGTKVLNLMDSAGNQAIGAAGMASWTNYSVEARVKVLATSGTSSSDGVAICARLTGPSSFYYLMLINGTSTKSLKIKVNNGNNSSLGSSLDSTPFMETTLPSDWVTLRLDVQGNVLTAWLNGGTTPRGSYTVTDPTQVLPMGGIGLMVVNTSAEFDDVVVRALP